MAQSSYAAEILRRDPASRRINVGLLLLVMIMVVSRIPALVVSPDPQYAPAVVDMVEGAAAIASGTDLVPFSSVRPRVEAYLAAGVHSERKSP